MLMTARIPCIHPSRRMIAEVVMMTRLLTHSSVGAVMIVEKRCKYIISMLSKKGSRGDTKENN